MIPTKKDQQILSKWYESSNVPSLYELIEIARNDGRAYLTDITHRNYEATKRRGLIDERTRFTDITDKIYEEVNELYESYNREDKFSRVRFDPSELADIALVCFTMAEHYGIDLIEEMRKKTEFNEKRP